MTDEQRAEYQKNWASYDENQRNILRSKGFNENGGNKNAPPPQDYQGAADADLMAMRPNQTNAFGSSVNWTKNPDGTWSQNQSFGGLLGGLSNSLQGQAANAMGQPMDWSQFGKVGTGDDAADQVYGQMTARLNPQWQQRDEGLQAQLAAQGLDPQTSAAGRMAMQQQAQAKNDAYGAARSASFSQGQDMFRSNMMARQQAIAEALRARGLPMQEMAGLSGFLSQPGISGSSSQLQAAGLLGNYNLGAFQAENEAMGDIFGGLFGGLGSLGRGVFGGGK